MAVHVFETMGTVVSLGSPDALPVDAALAVEAVFDEANQRFSLYLPASELSRVSRGELDLLNASEELRDAYAAATEWRAATSGAFTPHRPDGVIDLNGIVKALAIQQAGAELEELLPGATWIINCGGDMLANGEWTVGIMDPTAATHLIASIRLGADDYFRAVATSGTAERGDHIWGRSATFEQVSVVAADIVTADVLATAIMAGGRDILDLATDRWPIEVLAISAGELVATPGFRSLLAAR
jgi:thiamine biosynthesis lipoprotein